MDKFASQVQVEETAEFQAWLDAQEVADIQAMEAEALRMANATASEDKPQKSILCLVEKISHQSLPVILGRSRKLKRIS